MLKRFIPVAGALALMAGVLVGCQDSPATAPSTGNSVTTQDPYTAILATENLNDFQDAPSFDQLMNDPSFLVPPAVDPGRGGGDEGEGGDTLHPRGPKDPRDTTHRDPRDTSKGGPKPPRDTTHNKRPDSLEHRGPKGPRDTTHHEGGDTTHHNGGDDTLRGGGGRGHGPQDSLRVRPVNYGQIISQLHLTKEQGEAIRGCFNDLNECTRTHAEEYRAAQKALRDSLQSALRAIRAAVESGEITREEAKARMEPLVAQYRQDGAALQAAFRAATDACRADFEACVASQLTAEQLAKWQQMIRR